MKKDEKEEIEHILILVVHGMGSDDGSLKQCKREFERSLNDIIRYWFWEIKVKVEVQFIDWKQTIISEQERLYNKLLPNEPFTQQFEFWNSNPRHVLNHSLSDLLFYMTPHYGRLMVKNATEQLNTIINGLSKNRRDQIKKILLVGHSLGCVILHEIMTGQILRPCSNDNLFTNEEETQSDISEKKNLSSLTFSVDGLLFLGSPLTAFYYLRESSLKQLMLPHNVPLYNVYHPHDPVAFRLESVLYKDMKPLPPSTILPYWRNNSRRDYQPWDHDAKNFQLFVTESVRSAKHFARDQMKKILPKSFFNATLKQSDETSSLHEGIVQEGNKIETICENDAQLETEPGLLSLNKQYQEERQLLGNTIALNLKHRKLCPSIKENSNTCCVEAVDHVNIKYLDWFNTTQDNLIEETLFKEPYDTNVPLKHNKVMNVKKPCKENENFISKKTKSLEGRVIEHYQNIHATERYGIHDKKPACHHFKAKSNSGTFLDDQDTSNKGFSKGPKKHYGVKFGELLKILKLDTEDKTILDAINKLKEQYYISTKHSSFKVKQHEKKTLQSSNSLEPTDIFSECEASSGLQLPFRIDFELQELTVEHYIVSVGHILSHFNYWKSKDVAFFLLKQTLNFRPRVPYPLFIKLIDLCQNDLEHIFQEKKSSSTDFQNKSNDFSSNVEEGIVKNDQIPPLSIQSSFIQISNPNTSSTHLNNSDSYPSQYDKDKRRHTTQVTYDPKNSDSYDGKKSYSDKMNYYSASRCVESPTLQTHEGKRNLSQYKNFF